MRHSINHALKNGLTWLKALKRSDFISFYAGTVTAVLVGGMVMAFAPVRTHFDEIDVERINIVEPDGTLRTVISNKSLFPGTYKHGVEHPREDRPTGGMIFLDDEGSEIGGLVYGGSRAADGTIESHGHMSFDQYNATQVFAVSSWEEGGERGSRLYFSDWRERDGENGRTRLVLGKGTDRSVGMRIKDSDGRDRIIIRVTPDNKPELLFLDDAGKVTNRVPAVAASAPTAGG
jgi:hypothetical protein